MSDAEIYLDLEGSRARLVEFDKLMSEPGLWDDQDRARQVTTENARVKGDVDVLDAIGGRLSDAETLFELAREEGDDSVAAELDEALAAIDRQLSDLELRSLFSGEHDERDAVCEVHAGEGGTDAQDWAEMLLRMYLRWAERRGFATEVDEAAAGREAGLLSATFLVKGRHAYGLLRGEQGVHRLVRMS